MGAQCRRGWRSGGALFLLDSGSESLALHQGRRSARSERWFVVWHHVRRAIRADPMARNAQMGQRNARARVRLPHYRAAMSANTNYTDVDRVRALAAFEVSAEKHLALRDDDDGEAASWERCRDRIRGASGRSCRAARRTMQCSGRRTLVARREYLRESLTVCHERRRLSFR